MILICRVLWFVVTLLLLALPALGADQAATADDSVTVSLETALAASVGLLVAISAFLSAVIPPKAMPKWLRTILDLIGQNWGHATNAPADPPQTGLRPPVGPAAGRR